jgi:hypothetical protein
VLQDFLKLLQDAQSSSSGYGAAGTAAASNSLSALLVNYQT